MTTRVIFSDNAEAIAVLGKSDEHIKLIRNSFTAHISTRGDIVNISGTDEDVKTVKALFSQLQNIHRSGNIIQKRDVEYRLSMYQSNKSDKLSELCDDIVILNSRGRQIKPKTIGQKAYIDAIRLNYITIGIGPAGTGKTYLAVAMAALALRNREVERLILTRPAVEAGEKLGFLPGDMQEKVNPYLRPLYDALTDILGVELFQKHIARGIIEVAPLAYMRGRTLDNAIIILDEAQNATPEQMKMFLTRLGFGSKMIAVGDITQVDLPMHQLSGLVQATRILVDVEGIGVVYLNETDVVRHEVVGRVVKAYAKFEEKR
ncbi:MAG: PhoH family protein [Bacillota bacterium]